MQLKLVFPLSVLYIGFHAHPNRTLAHCNQSYGKTPLATCLATYALSLHNIPPQVNQIQQPISHTTNPCFEWNVCFTYLINFKLIFALLRPRTAVELATWISLCWQFYFLYLLNGFAFHIHFDRNFCNHIFHMKSKIHFFKQIWQRIKRDVCEKNACLHREILWMKPIILESDTVTGSKTQVKWNVYGIRTNMAIVWKKNMLLISVALLPIHTT